MGLMQPHVRPPLQPAQLQRRSPRVKHQFIGRRCGNIYEPASRIALASFFNYSAGRASRRAVRMYVLGVHTHLYTSVRPSFRGVDVFSITLECVYGGRVLRESEPLRNFVRG